MVIIVNFICDKCGLCCQSLKGIDLYKDLDDGTGTCKYFDKNTNLCKIYYHRPEKCNVEAMYKYFEDKLTYNKWINLNIMSCQELKQNFDRISKNGR